MGPRFSLRELELITRDNVPDQIRVGMWFAANHEERRRLVERAIDWVSIEFTKTRQDRQDRSEDGLTGDLVTALRAMGFQASHDTMVGGHCDVVIEAADNFLWLGEAKIHGAYGWLVGGFQQLDTRYAAALPGQDHGGMIIFCYNANTKALMDEWRERLSAARSDVEAWFDEQNPLIMHSRHVHGSTGLPYRVRHIPISLHFSPKDRR